MDLRLKLLENGAARIVRAALVMGMLTGGGELVYKLAILGARLKLMTP